MTEETFQQKLAKLRHDPVEGQTRHFPKFRENREMEAVLALRDRDPQGFAALSPLTKMSAGQYEVDKQRAAPPDPVKPAAGLPGSPEYEALLADRRAWLADHPNHGGNAS